MHKNHFSVLLFVQTANRRFVNHFQVYFVAKKFPDIVYPVSDHCRSKIKHDSMGIYSIYYRSRERPKPATFTSSGNPIGKSISGRNMPEFPISTHLFSPSWNAYISIDGSVYGLYVGLKRNFSMPECSQFECKWSYFCHKYYMHFSFCSFLLNQCAKEEILYYTHFLRNE